MVFIFVVVVVFVSFFVSCAIATVAKSRTDATSEKRAPDRFMKSSFARFHRA
jgi:hypothetical protein